MSRMLVMVRDSMIPLEEAIMLTCAERASNGESDIANSVFHLQMNDWFTVWMRLYAKTTAFTHSPENNTGGVYRFAMATPFGVVHLANDSQAQPGFYEVEWGVGVDTYEECIRQGELWMQRAVEARDRNGAR